MHLSEAANYFPITGGKMCSIQDLPRGSLGYIAGQSRPSLTLLLPDQSRGLMELGGERSLNMWLDEYQEGTAWTIDDWRLEVDPTSMVEGSNASLMMGCAFRQGERSGLVGMFTSRFHMHTLFPVDTTGNTSGLEFGTKAFFSRWRIMVTLNDGEVVIVDDEGKARPRG